jgi:hypothetical protein
MKAILIDAEGRGVREVEIDGTLEDTYKVMGVQMIEVATYLPNGDCIYVDEEGLINGEVLGWFEVYGAHQPFAGNGLVVGTDHQGETVGCKSTLDEITKLVSFPKGVA